jgi:hypothetical protein
MYAFATMYSLLDFLIYEKTMFTFLSVLPGVEKGFVQENPGIDPHHIHS